MQTSEISSILFVITVIELFAVWYNIYKLPVWFIYGATLLLLVQCFALIYVESYNKRRQQCSKN